MALRLILSVASVLAAIYFFYYFAGRYSRNTVFTLAVAPAAYVSFLGVLL